MTNIHANAVVDPNAELGKNVEIGPFCVVGPHVRLGDGVKLLSHVVVDGDTQIGPNSIIYPFACLGSAPQDLKFKGESSCLRIGGNNTIREHVTMNPGTEGGGLETRVGDHCLFMVGSHVAHDCKVGSRVILANNATLAGHVEVGDFAILGGLSAVHQFVRIGPHAMVGGMSGVEQDVIPFGSVMGERANLCGLNIIGLKRRGFDKETILRLRSAYRRLFSEEGTLQDRVSEVESDFSEEETIAQILSFMRSSSGRGMTQPKAGSVD